MKPSFSTLSSPSLYACFPYSETDQECPHLLISNDCIVTPLLHQPLSDHGDEQTFIQITLGADDKGQVNTHREPYGT
jgi:hypothetical protein